ncbi:MAG: type VI secretion system tip protein VgrG [Verrucomicrobia bacterium]|nr:type VI secretion system tip protein VgrG [Verrucomicrobiota bacterium]
MPFDQTNRIASVKTPFGANEVGLLSLDATETLARLPSFEMQLISENKSLNPKQILGQTVGVTLNLTNQKKRYFHGHAIQFGRATFRDRYYVYQTTVVPWLWFLTRAANCRIFQNKSVVDIFQKVCKDHGFDQIELRLKGNYTAWEYCVQYRETDFNFVSRLLEQEGIYYFFKYEEDKHTMVLADSPSSHQPFPGYEQVKFRPISRSAAAEDPEQIRDFASEMKHVSGKFTHTDYDFEKPRTDLKTQSQMPGQYAQSNFEVYDYPGEYVKRDDGETWARTRMEEIHTETEQGTGWGDSRGIASGSVFTLTDSPFSQDNRSYLVTSAQCELRPTEFETVSESVDQVFQCQFVVQPSETQFRPGRITQKPKTLGVQTAVVVGKQGDEIYTDKYGRIKVQFHWDREGKRDQDSSCWMRVAQAWAGRRWGSTFIPRVGQEVIVDFLEGDPDQPIVTGTVYNADQMPPYLGQGLDSKHSDDPKVSGIKTNSTKGGGGFNEIRFDDNKGQEQVFIHAEKDMDLRVKNDQHTVVQKNYSLKVGSATYREQITDDGMHHVDCSQEFGYKSIKIMLTADMEMHLKAGASFIKLGPDGIYISGPMVYINSGGSADSAPSVEESQAINPDPSNNSKSGSPSN